VGGGFVSLNVAKPDPRPRRRVRLSSVKYALLRAELLVLWPLCATGCGRLAHSAHHVVPRGDGDDTLDNLVGLCGDGTRGCHGDVEHRRNGARERVRAHIESERPRVAAYVIERKGQAWFDRHYPHQEVPA
jgi:hypothetical protein